MIDLAALALACAPTVHVDTLSAVVRHESRGNPYAIGVNGPDAKSIFPRTKDEAVAIASRLIREGRSADFGLGQINGANMDWLGLSVDDLFDPCKNLAAAAKVLTECYGRATGKFDAGQPALQAALSCYNTGNFERGFGNGYVQKVARQVVPALEPGPIVTPVAPVKLKAVKPEAPADPFGTPNPSAFGVAEDEKSNAVTTGE